MNTIGAKLKSPQCVFQRQTPIVVTVPIDAYLGARAGNDAFGEVDQILDAIGRGMTHGVAEA